MKKLLLLLTVTFMFAFIYFGYSQDSTDTRPLGIESESDDYFIDWSDFKSSYKKLKQPRIDISYGFTSPFYHQNAYKGELSPANMIEIKLGFEMTKSFFRSNNIYKYNYTNFSIANIKEYSTKNDNLKVNEVKTEAFKFGLNNSDGYGYNLGSNISLGLGTTGGLVWTKLNFLNSASNAQDQAALDYFGDDIRFGTLTESNINVKIGNHIGLNAAYERSVVFPRTMFWYWAGSELTKGAASGLLNIFIREVGKSSPEAIPVVNFVLNSALNYGFYELRKQNMNWPIDTEAPFLFDSFKIGINANF